GLAIGREGEGVDLVGPTPRIRLRREDRLELPACCVPQSHPVITSGRQRLAIGGIGERGDGPGVPDLQHHGRVGRRCGRSGEQGGGEQQRQPHDQTQDERAAAFRAVHHRVLLVRRPTASGTIPRGDKNVRERAYTSVPGCCRCPPRRGCP